MSFKNTLKESAFFLKSALINPKRLGALFPSSRFLAKAVVAEALKNLHPDDYLLELGPGTGSFTQALFEAGLPVDRWIGIEMDERMANYLKNRFPRALIIQGSAVYLNYLLPLEYQGKIGAVISGLPFLSMSLLAQEKIMNSCFQNLKPKGRLIQFTYGFQSSIKSDLFGLKAKRVRYVFFNLPPAHIWTYTQKEPLL
jgi:phosphatidylethanolamine/phosphatidyl-N-methylethanolamine N-methyltransferase